MNHRAIQDVQKLLDSKKRIEEYDKQIKAAEEEYEQLEEKYDRLRLEYTLKRSKKFELQSLLALEREVNDTSRDIDKLGSKISKLRCTQDGVECDLSREAQYQDGHLVTYANCACRHCRDKNPSAFTKEAFKQRGIRPDDENYQLKPYSMIECEWLKSKYYT